MPLPQLLCENPNYLPPALPPKRQRGSSKTLTSSSTPPSSPRSPLNESIDENAEVFTQNLNYNNNNNITPSKNVHALDTFGDSSSQPLSPVTPSALSNIPNVQLLCQQSTIEMPPIKSPTMSKGPSASIEPINHVTDVSVRPPIYSNDMSSAMSRFSDENHYKYLHDGDKHKPTKNGIDSVVGGKNGDGVVSNIDTTLSAMSSIVTTTSAPTTTTATTTSTSTATLNSNSKPKNNISNSNSNSNISDNNENDDGGIVVLRKPPASKHKLQQVRFNFITIFTA